MVNTDEILACCPPLAEVVKDHVLLVYRLSDNNKVKAAAALGVSLKTLYSYLNRYAEQEGIAS